MSLEQLFEVPWFTPVWCVQEVRLVQDAIVIWGRQQLSWKALNMRVQWIHDTRLPNVSSPARPLLAGMRVLHAHRMGMEDPMLFLTTLGAYNSFNATDPRGKVYALLYLGLVLEEEREAIHVDYSKGVYEVFVDTVLVRIEAQSQLDGLTFVTHPWKYDGDDEFRSWAPRWDRSPVVRPMHDGPLVSRPWAPYCQYTTMEIDDINVKSKKLCLSGIAYGEVERAEHFM